MKLFHENPIFETVKSKVIISLFETVRLSVSISPRNLYNSLKSIKKNNYALRKVVVVGIQITLITSISNTDISKSHLTPNNKALIHFLFFIQSTLVISTSVISNNRLSRRKNLVLVITQKSKIRL